ncbi:nuclear receptor subfamily 0 group B member 1 isoform X2 [Hypanus sabinus]|uniref:nuclear receptor subfamily 0 group B member 1 isoform X2 n=1 Tax=Hypanus sabinus TaxID=79690 RepID=UPI0028C492A8|nr:nuclear receptor subfamily 0 group B member 1 isoform X2 [Hypanus sabinus]
MSSARAHVCQCKNGRGLSSILYKLLKDEGQELPQGHLSPTAPSAVAAKVCACSARRRVVLKCPHVTCAEASAVLAKTLTFIKNVPCFQALPSADQLALLRRGWAPLLVLGLAQDKVDFETVETNEASILHMILTNGPANSHKESGENHSPSAAEIQTIKRFLMKCWSLDISPKEYAYLKGTLLFNPVLEFQSPFLLNGSFLSRHLSNRLSGNNVDSEMRELPGLHYVEYIQSLQQEAHQALKEYVKSIYKDDQSRFFNLIITLSMLRCISADVPISKPSI